MSDFPLDDYLARIGWDGPVSPTPETLIALHRHHVFAIPFENIDPFSGHPVSVEPSDLIAKIVSHGRGGYCFEQNGLFLLALEAIGFRTQSLCARVLISPDNYGPRSHQITLVEFEGGHRWLADVGFGGNGLVEAIPLELECEFDQKLDRFRVVEDSTHGFRFEHILPTGWRTLYAFSLDPYLPSDFALLNYAICRSPASIFTQVPLCIRTSTSERRVLTANQFKVRTADGSTTARALETSAQLREILTRDLGIPLPADYGLPAPPQAPPGIRDI